jgi:small subunit ribosomal protein S4
MARYLKSRIRIIRRLGVLPSLTVKVSQKKLSPGEHGKDMGRHKNSQYGTCLNEKQKVKFAYGVSGRQMLRYMVEAKRRTMATGYAFLQLLEMRLDTVLYTLQCFPTLPACRQCINHGHVKVNDRRVNIPSYQCKPKDVIALLPRFQKKLRGAHHLSLVNSGLGCTVVQNVNPYNLKRDLELRHIVEFYSRK